MVMSTARPLPTKANKIDQQHQASSTTPTTTSPQSKRHRPTPSTTSPQELNLPNYEIELYWKKERQWWHIDHKTTIHSFHQAGNDETGSCIASWGVRKRVRCRWRRVCEENYDDDGPSSSSSEEECSLEQQRSVAQRRSDSDDAEESVFFDPNNNEESVTRRDSSNTDSNNVDEEEVDDEEEEEDDDANWWDYSSDESDDSSDEDYTNFATTTTTKRARRMLPCDAISATFGTDDNNNTLIKGGIYEYNKEGGDDEKWLVKIIEFTGKKLPIRRARCQIISHMHAAIQECFPNNADVVANSSLSSEEEDEEETMPIDRTIVMEETIKGAEFLSNLVISEEDFHVMESLVEYDLKRDRSNKLIAEFTRRRGRCCDGDGPSSSTTTGAASMAAASGGNVPASVENNVPETSNPKPKELVLFAGVGGCSIGDEEAGFDCKWLVDKDHLAAASLRQCHPNATIYDEDVGAFLDKCSKQQPGYPIRGDVGHLQCSSPCNGFSSMNINGGRNDNTNNVLCHEFVRATRIYMPKTAMFENVVGILDASNVHHIIKIVQDVIRLKYQVRVAVLNSADYGVPQKRKRVIITLARADMPMPPMPSPTHRGESLATLGDAIQDLLHVECEMGKHRSGLVELPDGKLTFNHVARPALKSSKTLDMNEPVACITTQNSFKHPVQTNRTLSIREYARLFGFPDCMQFFGSYSVARKQIGNSVPVPLARAISTSICRVHQECRGASTVSSVARSDANANVV